MTTAEPAPAIDEGLPHVDEGTGLRRSSIRHPDGEPPNLHGCRWCGWNHEGYALYVAGRGFHIRESPTFAQIAARIAASRAHQPAQPAPAGPPARCNAMTHDGRGHETYCDIDDPEHEDDHNDGHGMTWEREDD